MKKLWRRILILSVILVMAMSVHAMADETQYRSGYHYFNNYSKSYSSNSIVFTSRTKVRVNFTISAYGGISSGVAQAINSRLYFGLQDVKNANNYVPLDTHRYKNNSKLSYDETVTVNAGTYALCASYYGSYSFRVDYRIYGEGGIDVPDRIEIVKGTSETLEISQKSPDGSIYYVKIKSAYTDDDDIAEVTDVNNTKMPPEIVVRGDGLGQTLLTVKGADGSIDQMTVVVVKKKSSPTLTDYYLDLDAGDSPTIKVNNASGKVTWSTSNSKVATIKQKGKKGYKCQIKAVGHGKAVIKATTSKNGVNYTLACEVKVGRATPNFIIYMSKLVPSKKTVKIKINNKSGVPMYVYKKGLLLDWPDYDDTIRNLSLANGSTIKIADDKAKTLTFKISGSKLKLDGRTINDFGARIKIKIDGLKYYARCTHDKHLGEYIRTNKLSTEKWQFSYLAYGV